MFEFNIFPSDSTFFITNRRNLAPAKWDHFYSVIRLPLYSYLLTNGDHEDVALNISCDVTPAELDTIIKSARSLLDLSANDSGVDAASSSPSPDPSQTMVLSYPEYYQLRNTPTVTVRQSPANYYLLLANDSDEESEPPVDESQFQFVKHKDHERQLDRLALRPSSSVDCHFGKYCPKVNLFVG